jgi:hypothetical protein
MRALFGSDIPPVDSSESLSEIANIDIKRARKMALSGQQVQADSLAKNTKTKLTVLSKGDNVIIPIPSVDRGPHSTISYSLSLSHSYHSLGLQTHLKWLLQQIEPDFYTYILLFVQL